MFLQQLINGITIGSIYALVSIGFTMVFGVLELTNFANGSLYMLGAYLSLMLYTSTRMPFFLAFFLSILLTGAAGFLLDRIALRRLRNKKAQAENFRHIEEESNKMHAQRLIQGVDHQFAVVNPPYPPMTTEELDAAFDLPYTRMPHPKYKGKTIPAYEMIKFSVNLHRGCFGGCAFCTISAHQGKFVVCRSKESILREVKQVIAMPDFKGYLSDLGGPSANMYASFDFSSLLLCNNRS